MRRRGIRTTMLLTAAIAGLALAPAAQGATTIGQIANDADPTNCTPETALITTSVSSGNTFTVPAGGGVITSWSTNAGSGSAGTTAKLKVYRTGSDASHFLVVGQSAFQAITASSAAGTSLVNGPFLTRVPVQENDWVSIFTGDNGGPCLSQTASMLDTARTTQGDGDTPTGQETEFNFAPALQQRANVSAVLEADADGDGFGDETQDNCAGSNGPNAGCPVQSQPVDNPKAKKPKKKKKCKKGKKRASSSGVLGKKCKKKKK